MAKNEKGTEKFEVQVVFDADMVAAAVEAAIQDGMLCGPCMAKVETLAEMSRSDFCATCQGAIEAHLHQEAQRRVDAGLKDRGLPSGSAKITTE
jgi:hypothetical protein